MQTTEAIKEEWNMYSLFLPRIIDVAEKNPAEWDTINTENLSKTNYFK